MSVLSMEPPLMDLSRPWLRPPGPPLTFTPDKGWVTPIGPWQSVLYVKHAWIPDPMLRFSEWLIAEGYKVEIDPVEDESVDGRVYWDPKIEFTFLSHDQSRRIWG